MWSSDLSPSDAEIPRRSARYADLNEAVSKQIIGDGLRFRNDERRATEVTVAVHVMNRMLELGRPLSIRIA